VCTRFAGSAGALAVALAIALAAPACSGVGGGAGACRDIERARCDRKAECEDWSKDHKDQCRLDGDAACHAGAIPAVRDASGAAVDTCVEAIGDAPCEALDDPFALPGCAPLGASTKDAGVDAAAQ